MGTAVEQKQLNWKSDPTEEKEKTCRRRVNFPVSSNKNWVKGVEAYQLGNTSSRTITEVKQRWAQLVLRWETV